MFLHFLFQKDQEGYEVTVENGKLVHRQSGMLVDTVKGSKWMFLLSAPRALCVGQKGKGSFHDSSFLSGGAAVTTGRLVAHNGVLKVHYACALVFSNASI